MLLHRLIRLALFSMITSSDSNLKAIEQISTQISIDNNYPEIGSALRVESHKQPSASGLSDGDYPSTEEKCLTQMQVVNATPIPQDIAAELSQMQITCQMGVFTCIERAWLSIDNILYLWEYKTGSDPTYYDGLQQAILSVGLCRPNCPGLLPPQAQYLLIIATPLEITMLAVYLNTEEYQEVVLHPTPLFRLSTDGATITQILSTSNGRVFLSSTDCSIYEAVFVPASTWLGRTTPVGCKLVNHSKSALSFLVPGFLTFASDDKGFVQLIEDGSRNILYARTFNGSIYMYDLGVDGTSFSRVAVITESTLTSYAASIARNVDKSNFHPLIHIAVIPKRESMFVQLLGVTNAGVRFYFNVCPHERSRPSWLSLVHVRLPPGLTTVAAGARPFGVTKACYSRGTLLLSSHHREKDILWCISSDMHGFHVPLMESHTCVDLESSSLIMADISDDENSLHFPKITKCDPPVLVTQFYTTPRRYLILSPTGSLIIEKLRPVEQLRHLLQRPSTKLDNSLLTTYINGIREEQFLAISLLLICSKFNLDMQVQSTAISAFFMYGGEPKFLPSNLHNPQGVSFMSDFVPFTTSTPHPNAALKQNLNPSNVTGTFKPSLKYNAICLFIGRLLRNLWDCEILVEQVIPQHLALTQDVSVEYFGAWTDEQLKLVFSRMVCLKEFMFEKIRSKNSDMLETSLKFDCGDVKQNRYTEIANCREQEAFVELFNLVCRICELISFLRILFSHPITPVMQTLSEDLQKKIKRCHFIDLLLPNNDLVNLLNTALVTYFLVDSTQVEILTDRLRKECPSIFSLNDAVCAKANEHLRLALQQPKEEDRLALLEESLILFKRVTSELDLGKICFMYQEANFINGIYEVCVSAAAKLDTSNAAVRYFDASRPDDDILGHQMYAARSACYQHIVNCLSSYQAFIIKGGLPVNSDLTEKLSLTVEEASVYKDQLLSFCFSGKDKILHMKIYEWLLKNGMENKLLEYPMDDLESFLQHSLKFSQQMSVLPLCEILWKYYELNKDYETAAKVLCRLAERHSTEIDLSERINYLSRAALSAKSSPCFYNSELVKEIEDKLEVAELQKKIYLALLSKSKEHCEVLNCELIDVTRLYSEFADPFDLHECKLAIFECAGHSDQNAIKSIWQDIIDNVFKSYFEIVGEVPIHKLVSKLKPLFKTYLNKKCEYFPIDFVIDLLEKRSAEIRLPYSWVFTLFRDLDVPLRILLNEYLNIWKRRDAYWTKTTNPNHVLFVLVILIDTFIDVYDMEFDEEEASSIASQSLDFVNSVIVELQSSIRTDRSLSNLLESLEKIKIKLKNIC